ncbi:hypothetical protein [Geitlerinema calcuttense]|uniref:Pectate lyase superfamily protein domain-containing protein n=1 Tax=Geitlerinema calcuttense NRMC-F 0142 TaxID=2922238 RepID=A0ABT7LZN7_9CYAN|nr:hypothetical protein [Geitlerinema calcuttense]MDL5057474.1 hypothetical protein [Geitlerinema calcuttense NRMC-F 0142]
MNQTIYYVASNGNDFLDGLSIHQKSEKSGPFATLSRAREAIRQARKNGNNGSFIVEISGGAYFLDQTFTLEPQDSGTKENPVIYRARAGEKVVISGGRRIRGFRETKINGVDGWVTDLPEAMNFTQLLSMDSGRVEPGFPMRDSTALNRHGSSPMIRRIGTRPSWSSFTNPATLIRTGAICAMSLSSP